MHFSWPDGLTFFKSLSRLTVDLRWSTIEFKCNYKSKLFSPILMNFKWRVYVNDFWQAAHRKFTALMTRLICILCYWAASWQFWPWFTCVCVCVCMIRCQDNPILIAQSWWVSSCWKWSKMVERYQSESYKKPESILMEPRSRVSVRTLMCLVASAQTPFSGNWRK